MTPQKEVIKRCPQCNIIYNSTFRNIRYCYYDDSELVSTRESCVWQEEANLKESERIAKEVVSSAPILEEEDISILIDRGVGCSFEEVGSIDKEGARKLVELVEDFIRREIADKEELFSKSLLEVYKDGYQEGKGDGLTEQERVVMKTVTAYLEKSGDSIENIFVVNQTQWQEAIVRQARDIVNDMTRDIAEDSLKPIKEKHSWIE